MMVPGKSQNSDGDDGSKLQHQFRNSNELEEFIDENHFMMLQKVVSIVVPILFAIIVIVGLVGNSLVVIVVKFNPQMYSTTNLLIINLAIADLLFIIFCVPFTAWDYAFVYWPFGSVWCKVVQYLIVVCAYASIYTVSLELSIIFYVIISINTILKILKSFYPADEHSNKSSAHFYGTQTTIY